MSSSIDGDLLHRPTCLRSGLARVPDIDRPDWRQRSIESLFELARCNGIDVPADTEHTMDNVPCMFTSSTCETEAAHWLPNSEMKEPCLWMWCRLLDLAPWDPDESRQIKRDLNNLVPLDHTIHHHRDSKGDAFIVPIVECLQILIQELETMLAEQEMSVSMPDGWKWALKEESDQKTMAEPWEQIAGHSAVSPNTPAKEQAVLLQASRN